MRVLAVSRDGGYQEASVMVTGESSTLYNKAIMALEKISSLAQERGGQAGETVHALVRESIKTLAVVTGLVFVLGGAMALGLSSLITRRLKNLQAKAEAVAAGNLDACQLTTHAKDEIGRLEKAMMEMVCHLKEQLLFRGACCAGFRNPARCFPLRTPRFSPIST